MSASSFSSTNGYIGLVHLIGKAKEIRGEHAAAPYEIAIAVATQTRTEAPMCCLQIPSSPDAFAVDWQLPPESPIRSRGTIWRRELEIDLCKLKRSVAEPRQALAELIRELRATDAAPTLSDKLTVSHPNNQPTKGTDHVLSH